MRALRQAAEPLPEGWPTLRVTQPRPRRSRAAPRRLQRFSAGSVVLHLLLLAVLLFQRGDHEHEEQSAAPSFAVQFIDPGLPAPNQATPQTPPQAQVHLFDQDMPAPPVEREQPTENVPTPPPMHKYGTALQPHARSNPFAHVMPFDLTPRQSSRAYTSNLNGRALDLSAGPVVRNGRITEAVSHQMGTHGVSDWMDRLRDFVEDHKYYPREAADNGEQGSAVLRLTVARDGTVKNLVLVSSSGSHILDAAWMSVFRDNKLPPFNDDIAQSQITLPVELDYSLIYHR